jgi:hypothetical protein
VLKLGRPGADFHCVDLPSPALLAARRLARSAHAPIVPVDRALPAAHSGGILLADRDCDDALLAALAGALGRVEAVVVWLAGITAQDAVERLGRHGFEHGTINDVALPDSGTLAVLGRDAAAAAAHAAALRAPDRAFRALAIMPAFNEADVIFHAVGALVAEGVDVYLMDHESTDGTADAARPWLGRGLVGIESFPGDAGYPERNRTEMVWRDILRRVVEVSGEMAADWYLFVNPDEFREAPWPGVTLADGLREVDELGFGAVNFELLNFRPTPQDAFVDGGDVRAHLRHYEPPGRYDVLQVKAWKAQDAPVDLVSHAGHDVLFPGKRVFPVPFLLRHYPIRSTEHGRRKVLAERTARFAAEERAGGWHLQYDHYGDGADYLHERATLVAYDGDRVRADLLARSLRELLLITTVRSVELGAAEIDPARLDGWLRRRGRAALAPGDLERGQARLLGQDAGAGVEMDALAGDLGRLLEAQCRARGEVLLAAEIGDRRAALDRAA